MLDKSKRDLQGSESRDIFKRMHKSLAKEFYATDIDFVLVGKKRGGTIIAIFDYKKPRDRVTFAEVIAYNRLIQIAPIYIIEGESPENGPFKAWQYLGGDWRPDPPVINRELVAVLANWAEFGAWEAKIRG